QTLAPHIFQPGAQTDDVLTENINIPDGVFPHYRQNVIRNDRRFILFSPVFLKSGDNARVCPLPGVKRKRNGKNLPVFRQALQGSQDQDNLQRLPLPPAIACFPAPVYHQMFTKIMNHSQGNTGEMPDATPEQTAAEQAQIT
ncbi:hypothetical protein RZN18_28565, partial [Klebsiella pneumoniae]|uniref:hypothetical protein n=1 Tax=Klebsiella pneumoniae TaxID=573 RepID=UPI00298D6250